MVSIVKSAFNWGFQQFSRLRVSSLNKLDSVEAQKNVLHNLLRLGKGCKFYTDHGLKPDMSVEEFQSAVPIRSYEDFWRDYMEKEFPVVTNKIWPGTIPAYSWTSGTTTGARKYIPYNSLLKQNYTMAGVDLLAFHFFNKPDSKLFQGKFLSLTASESFQSLASGILLGEISGLSTAGMPWPFCKFKFPPSHIAKIPDWHERVKAIAELIKKIKLTGIGGMPSWLLVFLEHLGLNEELERGFFRRLFPDLQLFVHGGVNFQPYLTRFSKMCEGLEVDFREVYPASEGFIAVADRGFGQGLRLLTNHWLFFEFVPVNEITSSKPTRHWMGNVEKDVNYALILTNPAGLWCYSIGDTVRFVDLNPPRLLITGRVKFSLSAFGEHLIVEELDKAISHACEKLNLELVDYTVFPSFISDMPGLIGRHVYIIEFSDSSDVDPKAVSELIDELLCQLNDDYSDHRQPGCGLGEPSVMVAPKGFFANWMKSQGKLGDQFKVPRVVSSEVGKEMIEFMRKNFPSSG